MTPRLNPYAQSMKLVQPLIDLAGIVAKSGLELSLLELVKIRASQINGCAVCLAHAYSWKPVERRRNARNVIYHAQCLAGTRRSTMRASVPPWPGRKR